MSVDRWLAIGLSLVLTFICLFARNRAPEAAVPGLDSSGKTRPRWDPETAKLREQVIAASSSDEKSAAYRALFKHLGRVRLQELEADPDLGISLQASWEIHRVTRSVDASVLGNLDRDHGEKFLKHLSARIGTKPPPWWQETLLGADVRIGAHTYFGSKGPGVRGSWECAGVGKITASPDSFLNAGFAYRIDGGSRWSASVWSAGRDGLQGIGHHDVSMECAAGRLLVYGAESHGMYLEAFDAEKGTPLFRFCTCFWFNFPEAWEF